MIIHQSLIMFENKAHLNVGHVVHNLQSIPTNIRSSHST